MGEKLLREQDSPQKPEEIPWLDGRDSLLGREIVPRNQREYHDWMGEIAPSEEKTSPETRVIPWLDGRKASQEARCSPEIRGSTTNGWEYKPAEARNHLPGGQIDPKSGSKMPI
ncbi:MAG: hypothetical protein ACI4FY_09380 [Acetatifactor sp.]